MRKRKNLIFEHGSILTRIYYTRICGGRQQAGNGWYNRGGGQKPMTTETQDDSKYNSVPTEKRRCPPGVRMIAFYLTVIAGICVALFVIFTISPAPSSDRTDNLLAFCLFNVIIRYTTAIGLQHCQSYARWLALVIVAADCGLAGVFAFGSTIFSSIPGQLTWQKVTGDPDLSYVLTIWIIAMIILVTCFVILTHPKTVQAFEAE